MSPAAVRFTGLTASLCVALALAAYFFALGSDHAATNGDELLYAQITRLTADTGQWLPLQSEVERHRNTKPPALFWQGLVSTDWGKHYELWRLRYPNVLYTLGIAIMVFLTGRKLGALVDPGPQQSDSRFSALTVMAVFFSLPLRRPSGCSCPVASSCCATGLLRLSVGARPSCSD